MGGLRGWAATRAALRRCAPRSSSCSSSSRLCIDFVPRTGSNRYQLNFVLSRQASDYASQSSSFRSEVVVVHRLTQHHSPLSSPHPPHPHPARSPSSLRFPYLFTPATSVTAISLCTYVRYCMCCPRLASSCSGLFVGVSPRGPGHVRSGHFGNRSLQRSLGACSVCALVPLLFVSCKLSLLQYRLTCRSSRPPLLSSGN